MLTRTLRWLAVLPTAILAGLAASAASNLLDRLTFSWQRLDPDWFLSRVYIEGVSGLVLGVAWVYAGVKVAPDRRPTVGFVLAVLLLLVVGFLLFPAIVVRNWWAAYNGLATALGAASVAWSMHSTTTESRDNQATNADDCSTASGESVRHPTPASTQRQLFAEDELPAEALIQEPIHDTALDSAIAKAVRNNDRGLTAGADDLQELLQPLQQLSEDEFYELDPVAHDPEAMAPWDLLAFRADGTPVWWPATRNESLEGEWTPRERRRILLERIRENLPADFPQRPSKPRDIQKLLGALRHVAYWVTSGASDVLSSDL